MILSRKKASARLLECRKYRYGNPHGVRGEYSRAECSTPDDTDFFCACFNYVTILLPEPRSFIFSPERGFLYE